MKTFTIATSVLAYAVAIATAQDPIINCTYTATPCAPFNSPTQVITVYEIPFTATATASFDCHGCGDVTVVPRNCDGVGLPVETTSLLFLDVQSTTTVGVCSPTPD